MNRKLRKYVLPFVVGGWIGILGSAYHTGFLKLSLLAAMAGFVLSIANALIDSMEDNNNDNSGL